MGRIRRTDGEERERDGLDPVFSIQAWEGISYIKFEISPTKSYWNVSVPDTSQGGSFRCYFS